MFLFYYYLVLIIIIQFFNFKQQVCFNIFNIFFQSILIIIIYYFLLPLFQLFTINYPYHTIPIHILIFILAYFNLKYQLLWGLNY